MPVARPTRTWKSASAVNTAASRVPSSSATAWAWTTCPALRSASPSPAWPPRKPRSVATRAKCRGPHSRSIQPAIPGRGRKLRPFPFPALVFYRDFFGGIDDQEFERQFLRLQLQAELFLEDHRD